MRFYNFKSRKVFFLFYVILIVQTSTDDIHQQITDTLVELINDPNIYMPALILKFEKNTKEKISNYINSVDIAKLRDSLEVLAKKFFVKTIPPEQTGSLQKAFNWACSKILKVDETDPDTGFLKVFGACSNILIKFKNYFYQQEGLFCQPESIVGPNTLAKFIRKCNSIMNSTKETKNSNIKTLLNSIVDIENRTITLKDNENYVIKADFVDDFKEIMDVYNKMYEDFVLPVMNNVMEIFSLLPILQTSFQYIDFASKKLLIENLKAYQESLKKFCLEDKNKIKSVFFYYEKGECDGVVCYKGESISFKNICEEYMMIYRILEDVENHKVTLELEEKKKKFLEIFKTSQLPNREDVLKTIQRVLLTMDFLNRLWKLDPRENNKIWNDVCNIDYKPGESIPRIGKDENKQSQSSIKNFVDSFEDLKKTITTDYSKNTTNKSTDQKNMINPCARHLKNFLSVECNIATELIKVFQTEQKTYMFFFNGEKFTEQEINENVLNFMYDKKEGFILYNLNLQDVYLNDLYLDEGLTLKNKEILFQEIFMNNFANLEELISDYFKYMEKNFQSFKTSKTNTITPYNQKCVIEIFQATNDEFLLFYNFYLNELKKMYENQLKNFNKKANPTQNADNQQNEESSTLFKLIDFFEIFETYSKNFQSNFKEDIDKLSEFTSGNSLERYIENFEDYQKLFEDLCFGQIFKFKNKIEKINLKALHETSKNGRVQRIKLKKTNLNTPPPKSLKVTTDGNSENSDQSKINQENGLPIEFNSNQQEEVDLPTKNLRDENNPDIIAQTERIVEKSQDSSSDEVVRGTEDGKPVIQNAGGVAGINTPLNDISTNESQPLITNSNNKPILNKKDKHSLISGEINGNADSHDATTDHNKNGDVQREGVKREQYESEEDESEEDSSGGNVVDVGAVGAVGEVGNVGKESQTEFDTKSESKEGSPKPWIFILKMVFIGILVIVVLFIIIFWIKKSY